MMPLIYRNDTEGEAAIKSRSGSAQAGGVVNTKNFRFLNFSVFCDFGGIL